MNEAVARQLAFNTSTYTQSLWPLLLACTASSGLPDQAASERISRYVGPVQLRVSDHASTNLASIVVTENVDQELGAHLVSVFRQISEHQVELDTDAKNALYSRKRELYRR